MILSYRKEGGGFLLADLDDLPECTLKKMQSDDGNWHFVKGKAFIGKKYKYAPASRGHQAIYNVKRKKNFRCEIVLVYDEGNNWFGMMPTECLEFPEEKK